MNKLTPLLMVVCLSHALVTHAQSNWFGFNGGVSIHHLRDGGNVFGENFSSRTGGAFGLTSEFRQRNHLSLVLGLGYIGLGGSRNGIQPVSPYPLPPGAIPPGYSHFYAAINKEVTLDYFQLPVMARLTWGSNFQFYVNGGFFLGIQLHGEIKQSGTSLLYIDSKGQQPLILLGGTPAGRQSFDDDFNMNSGSNVGATGGAGFAVLFDTKSKLFFDARFEYGFVGVTEYNNKTTNVMLSLGYAWRLGPR